MVTAVSAIVVSGVTAAGGFATAVVGRRQPRSTSRRDDFKAITDNQSKAIERLERRLDEAEAEAERDRRRIADQDFALRYLASWIRELVAHIRRLGAVPPEPVQPVPEEARPYISV